MKERKAPCNCDKKKTKKEERGDRKKQEAEALSAAYKIVDEREQYCAGCGQVNYLSRSHLLARSARRDLIAEPDNIQLHCTYREQADEFGNRGCHARWESFNIRQMLTLKDFWENLAYVKEVDEETYERIKRLYYEEFGTDIEG